MALLVIVMLAVASCSSASPTPQRTGKIFSIIRSLGVRFLILSVPNFIVSRTTIKPRTSAPKQTTSSTVPKANILAAHTAGANEDFKLQVSTHMNWEHLLSPAPLSIGLLGDLMIMSSQGRDFAIDGELPRYGFIQYVKYPKSFRATLLQIGNEFQRAFMVAHNNMDKIRLLTDKVPGYMREATRILVTADEKLVDDYLPAPMERIRQSAEQSVSLSKAVVWQFENVMNLTSEVLEMCTSEKSIRLLLSELLDEVRYDEIIEALQEGRQKPGPLKDHRTKLVMFFQKITNIVKNVATKSIEKFANQIETTSAKFWNVHNDFVIDNLYVKALKATQAMSLVNNMAEIYVNVSDRYIMPSVFNLSPLIVTNPNEAHAKRSEWLSQCSEDSRAIVELIVLEKTKTIRQVERRSAQIKKEYAFLEEVKERQKEALRKKTEQEVKKIVGRMTAAERKSKVDELLEEKIEQDEFLRDNDFIEDYGLTDYNEKTEAWLLTGVDSGDY